MGVNNRQRRAAKQRRREQASRGRGGEAARATGGSAGAFGQDPTAFAIGLADLEVTAAVRRIVRQKSDEAGVRAKAQLLTQRLGRVMPEVLDMVLNDLLSRLLDAAVKGGWSPDDLGELVRRRAGENQVAVLAVLLRDHAKRYAWVGPAWRDQLDQLSEVGSDDRRDEGRIDRLVSRLWVAACLAVVPDVPASTAPPGARPVPPRPASSEADHRKLATVRALLAKAESTSYDEEAEALS